MNRIEIQDLRFSYGGVHVLKGVNTAFNENELVYILGKNGAGKSTLFKCMLRIFDNYGGQIKILGKENRKYRKNELARELAYIPQENHVVYNYSVFDMILMGTTATLKNYQTPGEKQREMVEQALSMVGIGHLRTRTFHNISGGERKLVMIARAIAQQAKVIVMDEPCANLDLGNQIRMMELLKILTDQGYTIILSSHDPEHILLYGDRVILIEEGCVKQEGKPYEVITEDVLHRIYGRVIKLCKIEEADIKMCVPLERLECV